MPIYKRCPNCGKRLAPSERCNCYRKVRERDRKRPKIDGYYLTRGWARARGEAMQRAYYMDLYALYHDKKIVAAEMVHHIEPLIGAVELKDVPSNLIPLTERSHRKIHKLYKTNPLETKEYLRNILKKFAKTYGSCVDK